MNMAKTVGRSGGAAEATTPACTRARCRCLPGPTTTPRRTAAPAAPGPALFQSSRDPRRPSQRLPALPRSIAHCAGTSPSAAVAPPCNPRRTYPGRLKIACRGAVRCTHDRTERRRSCARNAAMRTVCLGCLPRKPPPCGARAYSDPWRSRACWCAARCVRRAHPRWHNPSTCTAAERQLCLGRLPRKPPPCGARAPSDAWIPRANRRFNLRASTTAMCPRSTTAAAAELRAFCIGRLPRKPPPCGPRTSSDA